MLAQKVDNLRNVDLRKYSWGLASRATNGWSGWNREGECEVDNIATMLGGLKALVEQSREHFEPLEAVKILNWYADTFWDVNETYQQSLT